MKRLRKISKAGSAVKSTLDFAVASALAPRRGLPTTGEVDYELYIAKSFGEFLQRNRDKMLERSLPGYLMYLLHKKNLKRSQVVEDSGVDKAYVYQIFNGSKKPSRDKLIAIAFGMHLDEEETQRLLKLAGHSELYSRVARDALILFAIQRDMSIWETDEGLESLGFPTLLSAE